MSSTYRFLCLSHDPALELPGWETSNFQVAGNTDPRDLEELASHHSCDLLIGRFSYPLIQVGCPAMRIGDRHAWSGGYWHRFTGWVDVEWLRIMLAIQREDPPHAEKLLALTPRCWTATRVARLGPLLGLDISEW